MQLKYPSSVCLIEAGIQQYRLFLSTPSFSHSPCETLSTASLSENPISSLATTTTTTSTITMGEQRALLSPFSTFAQTSSGVLCWSHWIDFEPFFSAYRKPKAYSLKWRYNYLLLQVVLRSSIMVLIRIWLYRKCISFTIITFYRKS